MGIRRWGRKEGTWRATARVDHVDPQRPQNARRLQSAYSHGHRVSRNAVTCRVRFKALDQRHQFRCHERVCFSLSSLLDQHIVCVVSTRIVLL